MVKKRKMTAKQLKYFGKKISKSRKHRKSAGIMGLFKGRKSDGGFDMMKEAALSGAYGAGRGYTSDALVPLVEKIPSIGPTIARTLGPHLDNAVMIAVTGAAASGKVPVLKDIPYSKEIGRNGWRIEWALLGSELAQRFKTKTAATQSNGGVVIG
jgi:hypothetical protein